MPKVVVSGSIWASKTGSWSVPISLWNLRQIQNPHLIYRDTAGQPKKTYILAWAFESYIFSYFSIISLGSCFVSLSLKITLFYSAMLK